MAFGFIKPEDLENWFTFHSPTKEQTERYGLIRDKAKDLAILIVQLTPSGPDQTAAIRLLRETVLTANAAIACGEKEPPG